MKHMLKFITTLLLAPLTVVQAGDSTKPPAMQVVDLTKLPEGVERLELFLLMGQSNMKGRGALPAEQERHARIVMMHITNDRWYLAQHPLHSTGDPATMTGGDNAGVGPGLTFAEALVAREPVAMVGLIPCAVGGSPVRAWQKSDGRSLYDRAIQRAKLALEKGPPGRTRICGALWLQGESDSTEELFPRYQDQLLKLVDNLRADLQQPDLPFIACTIGSFIGQRPKRQFPEWTRWTDINEVLLALPGQRPRTACVDARDLKTGHIGDFTHYDTPSQLIIGQRFGKKYFRLTATKEPQK